VRSDVKVEEEKIGRGWDVPNGTPRPKMDVREHKRDGKRAQIGEDPP